MKLLLTIIFTTDRGCCSRKPFPGLEPPANWGCFVSAIYPFEWWVPTPGLAWSSCYFPAYCTSALLPRDAGTANVPQYLKINLLSFETIAGETLGKLRGRVLLQEQPTDGNCPAGQRTWTGRHWWICADQSLSMSKYFYYLCRCNLYCFDPLSKLC